MPQYTAKSGKKKFHSKRVAPNTNVKGYQLEKVKKSIKSMIPKPEKKFFDVSAAATVILSTGTVTSLFVPNPGTSVNAMIGDNCRVKSWFWRASILPNAVAGVNFLRILLVKDRQPNGVTPAVADILTTVSYISPLLDFNAERFKVIFDRMYTMDNDANGSQVDKIYRRLNFKYTANVAAAPNTNGLYLVQLSNQAANGPTTEWYSRVRFTDV